MKERPILFSGEMVRAILDGTKTQTRRIMKAQPPHHNWTSVSAYAQARGYETNVGSNDNPCWMLCPYGKIGDQLWVRETFYCDDFSAGDFESDLSTTPKPGREQRILNWLENIYYRADGELSWEEGGNTPWKPSIHMPRWASRITLEITGISIERIQNGGDREFWGEEVWKQNPWVWVIEFMPTAHATKEGEGE